VMRPTCLCWPCVEQEARAAARIASDVLRRFYPAWHARHRPRLYVLTPERIIFYAPRRPHAGWSEFKPRSGSRQNALQWVRNVRRASRERGALAPGATVEDWTPTLHLFLCAPSLCERIRTLLLCLQRSKVSSVALPIVQWCLEVEMRDNPPEQDTSSSDDSD
jgi:hypothetical protein